MYSQDQTQGPRFLWAVGFLALGTLSAIGASALFPWYLAIVIAILVAGLASACAFQFRETRNILYLVAMVLMTALAAGLDGVSVWEILNKRQNSQLSASKAEQSVLEEQLTLAEKRVEEARGEIALLVQEATDIDNDGKGENDHLIPGKLALIESKKADLPNLEAKAAAFLVQVRTAASITAKNDSGRHVLLQMAEQSDNPARWLITRAGFVFIIPEMTLALLAWSLRGGRREERVPLPQQQEQAIDPNLVAAIYHNANLQAQENLKAQARLQAEANTQYLAPTPKPIFRTAEPAPAAPAPQTLPAEPMVNPIAAQLAPVTEQIERTETVATPRRASR